MIEDFPHQPRFRFELSQRLSLSYRLKKCPDVEQRMSRAVTLAQELTNEFPSVTMYQWGLYRSLNSRAGHLRRTRDWESAADDYRAAIDVLDGINEQGSDGERRYYYNRFALYTKRMLADTLRDQGLLDESRALLEQTIEELESTTLPERRSRSLRWLYASLAKTLEATGDLEAANHWREKAESASPQIGTGLERSKRRGFRSGARSAPTNRPTR